ncbi:hypothetical protein [Devosia sp.]|uniref:hypothetical protein n=1 Tax=Devosia sp. TaxID=1871048 RepID=UPI002FCB9C47
MSTESDTRDRVIRLEEQVRHLTQAFLDMKESQDDTNGKVTELRDILLQGKGAAWAGRLIWFVLLGIIGALGLKLTGAVHWMVGR